MKADGAWQPDQEFAPTRRRAEVIAARLRRQILSGEVEYGESLPNEGVLASYFKASKPIVREALRSLEAESLIEVRRGAGGGPVVRKPSLTVAARQAGYVLQHQGTRLWDVYEALNIIEPPIVRTIAATRSQDGLARLEAVQAASEEAIDFKTALHLHVQFHRVLIELAENDTLTMVTTMLYDILEFGGRRLKDLPLMEDATIAHGAVTDLIRKQDTHDAEVSWQNHWAHAMARRSETPSPTLDVLSDT